MIDAKEIKLLSIQFSIFTPTLVFLGSKVVGELFSKFTHVFDGEPIILPLPQDIPSDIPRITLQSRNQEYKAEIAVSRVNLYKSFHNIDEENTKDFLDLCLEFSKEYVNCTNAQIGRLATVILRFLETKTPGLDLAQHFCKERWITQPLTSPQKFEIHFYRRMNLEEFEVNCWFRCKSGVLRDKSIILIEQDINTLSEDIPKKNFGFGEIKKFLQVSSKEHETLLNSYFSYKH